MTRPKACEVYYPKCVEDCVCYFPSFVLDKGCSTYTKEIKPNSVLRNSVKRGTIPRHAVKTSGGKLIVKKLNHKVI